MSDENAVDQEANEAPSSDPVRKGNPIRKIAIMAVLGFLGLSVGLVSTTGLGGMGKLISGEAASEEETQNGENPEYQYMNFDEIIVNIEGRNSAGRKVSRFMKVKLTLVYDGEESADITKRKPYIREAFQDYLRQVTEKEVQGSHGMLSLKTELLKRAKTLAGNDGPKEVLIGELIIQ